ncbi:MAG: hypothetical protein JW849_10760 [Phycisphaerae bacterium]|nr:hypothetical protein [Phycisphaerae bacterium]
MAAIRAGRMPATQKDRSFVVVLITIISLLAAGWCAAETNDILLPEGKTTNLPWTTADGAGFTWDIQQNGGVQHGTGYAYGNGMMLQVRGGQHFYAPNNTALLRAGGNEVQLGPFQNDKIRVWRRVYVNPKLGYARWIDVFENTDENPVKLDVHYQNHMGNSIQQCTTTTNQGSPGPKDWGFVSDDHGGDPRPAVMHVYASRRAKHRPDVQAPMNNNTISYRTTLTIPPGEMRALCFFEAQRNTFDEAVGLLKTFRPERELAKVPKALRDIIVNMSGDVLLIGRLEIPRSRASDKVVLRDESEVNGTILNSSFPVETFFGRVDLPAENVVGLAVLEPNDRFVQIALADGQIVGGVSADAPLKVRLADGKELALPPHRIATAGYHICQPKPEEISLTGPMLLLRSGQQLRFDPAALPLEFLTEYGPIRLKGDDLCELRLVSDGAGRLHQAIFRNGSILTGLWTAEAVQTPLTLGPKLSVDRETLAGVLFHRTSETDDPNLLRLRLSNGDVLIGTLPDTPLAVETELGEVTVSPKQIQTLRRLPGSPGRAAIQLQDETTVSGVLKEPILRFTVAPDVALSVHVARVAKLQRGKPKDQKATPPDPTSPPAVLNHKAHMRAELLKHRAVRIRAVTLPAVAPR